MPNPLPTRTVHPDGTVTVNITKLRQIVLESHKPQYVMAADAGIHPFTFSCYCRGVKDIKVNHLKALCNLLKLPPEDVIGWVSFTLSADGEVLP